MTNQPIVPDSHPASQFLNAQMAAWGAGRVIENADKWPTPGLSAEARELLVALDNTVEIARRIGRAIIKQNDERMTKDEAKRLNTRLMTNASIAYRLIRAAIGEPMFPGSLQGYQSDPTFEQKADSTTKVTEPTRMTSEWPREPIDE